VEPAQGAQRRRRWGRELLRTPAGALAASLTSALVVLAIFGPLVWGHDASHENFHALNQGVSSAHLLGTDSLGRDIFARVLVATRLSIGLAAIATTIAAVAGCVLGGLPVLLSRRWQRLASSVILTWMSFPVLVLALFVAILLGPGARTAVVALALTMTPQFARLVQTLAAAVGGSDYLAAARLLGVSRRRQLTRYVLPNIAEPVILNVTLSVGGALLALSTLSFLGLGVQPPSYDWGQLLGNALSSIYVAPAAAIGPAVAVVVAGLAFSFLGEQLATSVRERTTFRSSHRQLSGLPSPAANARAGIEGPGASKESLLEVDGLSVSFPMGDSWVSPVRDVSFSVAGHEIVGIVGESGSGKTLTALALGNLVPRPGAVAAARLRFDGKDLLELDDRALREQVGTDMAVVFQDSASALNPALRIGTQLTEVVRVHKRATRSVARRAALEALSAVQISWPAKRLRQFPHQLSGGMRQRVAIAMARMGEPKLVIADEPTSALDVLVQKDILDVLRATCSDTGSAALIVTHDISVIAPICDRILVMYAGRLVEDLRIGQLARGPGHPYTCALLESLPDLETETGVALATIPGRPPAPAEVGEGCAFAPRCRYATDRCYEEVPPLVAHQGGRLACWHPCEPEEVDGSLGTRASTIPGESCHSGTLKKAALDGGTGVRQ